MPFVLATDFKSSCPSCLDAKSQDHRMCRRCWSDPGADVTPWSTFLRLRHQTWCWFLTVAKYFWGTAGRELCSFTSFPAPRACGRNSADYHAGESCSIWLFRNILRASFEAHSNAHWHRGLKSESLWTQSVLFSLETHGGTFTESRDLCLNMIKDNHCCFSPPAWSIAFPSASYL